MAFTAWRWVTACAAVVLCAAPVAQAAPPPSDDRGYLDSTARCDAPSILVAFGRTETSRIAICKDSDGGYTYRGVRMRDGARLVADATAAGGGWTATVDGITYTVTATSLEVAAGSQIIRDEPMLGFDQPGAASASVQPATPTSTTPLPPPLPAEVGGR